MAPCPDRRNPERISVSEHDQHHQHHKEEHERDRKEKRDEEQKREQHAAPVGSVLPRWLLVIGIVLILTAVLIWTFVI